MVILLCYTSEFKEVIYTDFCAKILDWNFRLVDENSQILVVVFVSKFNFSFSFRVVDENYRIFVIVVVVFVTKINLFSSTKIFVFVVVDEKNTALHRYQLVIQEEIDTGFSRLKSLLQVSFSADTAGWVTVMVSKHPSLLDTKDSPLGYRLKVEWHQERKPIKQKPESTIYRIITIRRTDTPV